MISLRMYGINIFLKLSKLSDWIDEKFFPAVATEHQRKVLEMHAVEQCADIVQQQIARCKKLKDCYDAHDAIIDFRSIWGDTVQVNGWYDSLRLSLRNKEKEIMEQL